MSAMLVVAELTRTVYRDGFPVRSFTIKPRTRIPLCERESARPRSLTVCRVLSHTMLHLAHDEDHRAARAAQRERKGDRCRDGWRNIRRYAPVSYTHLTLPT